MAYNLCYWLDFGNHYLSFNDELTVLKRIAVKGRVERWVKLYGYSCRVCFIIKDDVNISFSKGSLDAINTAL